MMRLTLPAALCALISISGCTGLTQQVNDRVGETQTRASRLVKEVGQVDTTAKKSTSSVHENGVWIGKGVMKLQQKDNLPPIFQEPATFDRTVYSLAELAERITLRSGIPTKVSPDALIASSRALGNNAGATGA